MAATLGHTARLGLLLPQRSRRTLHLATPAGSSTRPCMASSSEAAAQQMWQQCPWQQHLRRPGTGASHQRHLPTAAALPPHARPLEGSRQQQQQQQQQRARQRQAAAADDPSTTAATFQPDSPAPADDEHAAAVLAQQLQDWGFTQIGEPLPEGLSLNALAETLPASVFEIDLRIAFGRVALSAALMAVGYYWLWYMRMVCPLWQEALCWLAIGTGYFGVFVAATDAAHFALCPSAPLLQDVIGATLMAPSLWAFETWRLQYFNHLLCVNMLEEDTDAWHPLTVEELSKMSGLRASLTRLIMGTPLKLWATIGTWAKSWGAFDLRNYVTRARPWMLLSWAVPFAFMGVVWPAMLAAGGLSGWVSWWLMPWLVFHAWLSLLTLVQHTAPFICFQREGPEYDAAQAVINGTTTLRMPRPLELLLHDANYHLPQHISMDIPSYRLLEAHKALQQRVGRYMNEAKLNYTLLVNLMLVWVAYDEDKGRYCDFDGAAEAAEARRAAAAAAGRSRADEQEAHGRGGGAGWAGETGAAAGPGQGAGGQWAQPGSSGHSMQGSSGVLLPQG